MAARRDARVAEWGFLLRSCPFKKGTMGSNPILSVRVFVKGCLDKDFFSLLV